MRSFAATLTCGMAKPLLLMVVLAVGAVSPVFAQVNTNLNGVWTLAQESAAGGGRGGGIPGVPIATELVINVSPSDVTVDANTGSARATQTAVYKLDGSQTTVPGPLGWDVTAKAAVENGKLVVTTHRSMPGPNGPLGVDVVDIYDVSGDVLTIDRSQRKNMQRLVYARKK
jgi:hypothetical protein